jgi:hypothetical protein
MNSTSCRTAGLSLNSGRVDTSEWNWTKLNHHEEGDSAYLLNAGTNIITLHGVKIRKPRFEKFILILSNVLLQCSQLATESRPTQTLFNPLNAELNPIRHLLALAGAHHFVHVSRIRVNQRPQRIFPIIFTWRNEIPYKAFRHNKAMSNILQIVRQKKKWQPRRERVFHPDCMEFRNNNE